MKNDLKTLVACLNAGASLNSKSSDEATLAVICAHYGWEEGLLELIKRGVDMSVGDSQGELPLNHALAKKHKACAWLCLERMDLHASKRLTNRHDDEVSVHALFRSKEEQLRLMHLLAGKNHRMALEGYVASLLRSQEDLDAVKTFCNAPGMDQKVVSVCRLRVIK